MADEFFSFDEALDKLRLKEEELKRLVSEGEIRAFRQGDTMKLRKGDVEALKSELTGGEVVDLGEPSEELVFEDDGLLDEAGMATEVRLDYGEGRTETWFILGEWDSDEDLGIISCNSRMAQALEGHVAGDQVTVPAVDGEANCTVAHVGELPQNIREWLSA